MDKFQVDGPKIAAGSVRETVKFVYLINPRAVEVLLRQQGHNVKSLAELMDLVDDAFAAKKRVDLITVMRLTPVSDEIIRSGGTRMKLVGTRRPKNILGRRPHNIDILQ